MHKHLCGTKSSNLEQKQPHKFWRGSASSLRRPFKVRIAPLAAAARDLSPLTRLEFGRFGPANFEASRLFARSGRLDDREKVATRAIGEADGARPRRFFVAFRSLEPTEICFAKTAQLEASALRLNAGPSHSNRGVADWSPRGVVAIATMGSR